MCSFYTSLSKIVEIEKARDNAPDYYDIPHTQLEAFRDYGTFLDAIPTEHRERIVLKVYELLIGYSISTELYANYFDDESEQIEKLFRWRKEESDNQRRRWESDLKRAKKFRETLETFDEFLDKQFKIDPTSIKIFTQGTYAEKPRFELAEILDDYIEDLETKTFIFADKHRYQHSFSKPSKTELSKYLKSVIDKHNIKATKKLKILIDNLNKN